jgi:KaiC/GvpD/RAD55 family RecA-like ATPase
MQKKSSQQFLEVEEIKEGALILKDKSLRTVIMVSSLNLALKSTEEQRATIYQFQNFLNSLDFFCQILVQTKKLNITGYLDKLKELENNQTNKLLKFQTAQYRQFIADLITGIPPIGKYGEIMTKNFFLIVPFALLEIPELKIHQQKSLLLDEEKFQRAKSQLYQRVEFVIMGLKRCGLQSFPLNSTELIEFFWGLYHLEQAEEGYYPVIPLELIK